MEQQTQLTTKLNKIPTIAELFSDDIEGAYKNEQLNLLLSTPPKKEWVKEHPFIQNYKYLPIDKVEYLLKRIFKKYNIEIIREGTSFNGVYVVVRVHYLNPVSNKMEFHDGIGAIQLQTKKGTSPADLANINNGAISIAFPIAKTIAIKDACDHFGALFGADLNRRDTVNYTMDQNIVNSKINNEYSRTMKVLNSCTTLDELNNVVNSIKDIQQYETLIESLKQRIENDK